MRIPQCWGNYSAMTFYRRRLPHIDETERPVFLTWRLHDSLPPHRAFPADALNSGRAFGAMDRLLDECRTGRFSPSPTGRCRHGGRSDPVQREYPRALCLTCLRGDAKPRSFAGYSSGGVAQTDEIVERHHSQAGQRDAGINGKSLWQEESYDHLVRHEREFEKIRNYIEGNPVRAGLVKESSEYRWSSAGWATKGVARGPGGPPHQRPVTAIQPRMLHVTIRVIPEAYLVRPRV